ncbi:sulfotransferase [Aquisalimonas sp. 2447]|uniref:sulfotransferase n=1 Tax=Aquisalimonas sp. 2447 TaxID=2740807 RepID=UPI0014323E06|nr:sulfotransferase [Aquisalimonas sp. 2447]QIT56546.1 sulfotransferase [Aquisalimonas sp. 2447]
MKQDPIFIVGTGRCGSTMFHDVLSHHGDLGWLSNIVAKKPGRPGINAMLNRTLDVPGAARVLRRVFRPSEPYVFWERYCKGFSRPYRDLFEHDVIPGNIPNIRAAFNSAIPDTKIPVAKITGWPRVRYLKEIFPGAKFVHIVRDGRAVVNSVLQAPYFDGWTGPEQWARGYLDGRQRQAWLDAGESFVVLAAIGWENRIRAFQEIRRLMPDSDYLEFR